MRYPDAEWVPWKPYDYQDRPTYYAGQNRPIAVVLHIMQGWATTARDWARKGMYPKSWHFTVALDGSIMQHLDFQDGGYHAGITAFKSRNYPPTWPLYKGHNVNVNKYTIGIEHEGFYDRLRGRGEPFTKAQAESSKRLCLWLANELSIPLDEVHFPPHAVIDLRDRPNDFAVPTARKLHYDYLLSREDTMAEDPQARRMAEEAMAEAQAAMAHSELRNSIMTIDRDLQNAINQWPEKMAIHKFLRENDMLREDYAYEGDYEGYA